MPEAETMMTELKALIARVLDDEVRDIEPGTTCSVAGFIRLPSCG